MGRKGIVVVMLVVAIAAVVGVALAARGDGSDGKTPTLTSPNASKRYGDDADLMRRLERKKLTTRSSK